METSFLDLLRAQSCCYPAVLATDVLRASCLIMPLPCLHTCTSSWRKACADQHEKFFCHVGFRESSSTLLQCAKSLGTMKHGEMTGRLSVPGLCRTAPAGRRVPDASLCNNTAQVKPTKNYIWISCYLLFTAFLSSSWMTEEVISLNQGHMLLQRPLMIYWCYPAANLLVTFLFQICMSNSCCGRWGHKQGD